MTIKSIAQGLHAKRVMKEARAKVAAQVAATMKYTAVREPDLTRAAQENLDEAGDYVAQDLADIEAGRWTPETLLAHCLDGADEDRVQGWREYVDALFAACESAPKRQIIKAEVLGQGITVWLYVDAFDHVETKPLGRIVRAKVGGQRYFIANGAPVEEG